MREEKLFDTLFALGMRWRVLYGALRFMLGVALMQVTGTTLYALVSPLMAHEFIEDPNDILYTFVAKVLAQHPVEITYFIAAYFIVWGFADIVLSLAVLHKKPHAYVASLVLIATFMVYEVWRFAHTHSIVLLGIIVVDIVLCALIYYEYKKLLRTTAPL